MFALEDERLELRRREDVVEIRDLGDQRRGLGVLAAVLKIAAHAVLERERLADVDDLAFGVLHEIYAGRFGKGFELFFDLVHIPLISQVERFFEHVLCDGRGVGTAAACALEDHRDAKRVVLIID